MCIESRAKEHGDTLTLMPFSNPGYASQQVLTLQAQASGHRKALVESILPRECSIEGEAKAIIRCTSFLGQGCLLQKPIVWATLLGPGRRGALELRDSDQYTFHDGHWILKKIRRNWRLYKSIIHVQSSFSLHLLHPKAKGN